MFKHFSSFHFPSVAPNVTIDNEKSLHVLESSNIEIECVIEASPRPVSYWIKEPLMRNFQNPYDAIRQNVLQDNERISIVDGAKTLYRTVSRLKISNFGENDVGMYSCVASNIMGRANSTIRLFGEFCKIIAWHSHALQLWISTVEVCLWGVKTFKAR